MSTTRPSATRPLAKAKVATSTNQFGSTRPRSASAAKATSAAPSVRETAGHQIFRKVVRWNSPSGRSASTSAITR